MCLDVGNTHILGGVFEASHDGTCNDVGKPVARFRFATDLIGTADQFGIFLINILNANHILPEKISAVAICSVVPGYDFTMRHAINLYFKSEYFVLQAGAKTGLNIKYKNPNEVGADRIANAIGAISAFPNKNIIIVDTGTATTVCAITKNRDYLGGAIMPGMRLGMESLKNNTSKLMEVNIEIPTAYIGRTTKDSIQSGLYYGQFGALQEIIQGIKRDTFQGEAVLVIGTGGFSQLFKEKSLFDILLPDLVLQGLCKAYSYSATVS